MMTYGGVNVWIHAVLKLTLDGDERSALPSVYIRAGIVQSV
jgi:hypothetical protein